MKFMARHVQQEVYFLDSIVQNSHRHQQFAGYADHFYRHYKQQPGHPAFQGERRPLFKMDPHMLAYYRNFHNAHPIMPPISLLDNVPIQVRDIMQHIGALYSQKSPQSHGIEAIIQGKLDTLSSITSGQGYQVQGMLLLAIYAHAYQKSDNATSIIKNAVYLALELGMNRETFAISNGNDSPLMEDMWRRTYWELYVVDALLSALQGQVSSLYNIESDVSLPCDEAMDVQMQPPFRRYTFSDLANNWPQTAGIDPDVPFFGYRIDAARLLGEIITHGPYVSSRFTNEEAEYISQLDAALSEWQKKRVDRLSARPMDHHGEVIFQAQFIAYCATAYLYRPKCPPMSIPLDNPMPMDTSLGQSLVQPQPSSTQAIFPNCLTDPANEPLRGAAESIGKLLTSRLNLARRSPFLIHAIELEVLIFIPILRHMDTHKDLFRDFELTKSLYRQYVESALHTLRGMEKIWPLAKCKYELLRKVYRAMNNQ